MESIQQVIDRFDFQGKTADCRTFGNGHINTTYIITTDLPEGGQQRYVLQKVNHNVFRDIDRLMQNVFAVTSFCRRRFGLPAATRTGRPCTLSRPRMARSITLHRMGTTSAPMCL